ncbi:MAG TPA: response regulator [Bryobacteraceae bacterium]|nr:response regulator [Bryobacteraceae bacterium]
MHLLNVCTLPPDVGLLAAAQGAGAGPSRFQDSSTGGRFNTEGERFFPLPNPGEPERTNQGDARAARILLIEDNHGDVLLVREALEEHAVKVEMTVLSDGEKAIRFIEDAEAYRAPLPDLIILDLNLPRISGHDVLRRIRASAIAAHVRVMILSSSTMMKDTQQAASHGVSRYIQKPSTLDEFMRIGGVIKALLTEH